MDLWVYGRVFYLNFSWVNSFVYSSMQKQILNTELQTIVLCILKHLLDFLFFFFYLYLGWVEVNFIVMQSEIN